MKAKAFLRLLNGEKQETNVKLYVEEDNGVLLYRIKGVSKTALNLEYGGGIEIRIEDIDKWISDYRYSTFWCKPKFGTAVSDIPYDTQALIYKKANGVYGVILPLVSDEYKCVLEGSGDCITAKLFSWCEGLYGIDAPAFVIAEGNDPYELLKKCADKGVEILNNGCRTREKRRYPETLEYLGWCSWDAFEIRVNEEDLIKKCEEFKKKNIPVRWMIIDDMWGEVRDFYGFDYSERCPEMFDLMHSSKLYSFNADPKRFKNGLKHCIDEVKKYGIKVGMWHPTTGYWRGIDPNGEIAEKHNDILLKAKNGMLIHDWHRDKAYMFYALYHDFLRKSGADFVKIDNQSSMTAYYKGDVAVGKAAREYHMAMEASVGEHFDGCMINCMGMANEDMWNRTVSSVSRCSNDFKPENREWFTQHILQCTFNSLIQGQFYYSDYDMWWTDDEQASKNSVLRAVSGGPIYVSDKLSRSNRDILMPLCLEDGRILRCDRPGVPAADCLFDDPGESGRIFKVQNISDETGYIAAFNLDINNNSVKGAISPSDVSEITGELFVIFEFFSREVFTVKKNEKIEIELKNNDDFRLYIISPVKNGFAVIGKADKYIASKAVKTVINDEIVPIEHGTYIYCKNGKLHTVEK